MSSSAAASPPARHRSPPRWRSSRYDWYDAAAFDEVVSCAEVGWLVVAYVLVGRMPGRDREQQANDAKLQALPARFKAWFAGGRTVMAEPE